MSDTATNGSLDSFLLDGDAPRLGTPVPPPPPPQSSPLDFEALADEPGAPAMQVELPPLPQPSLPAPTLAAPAPLTTDGRTVDSQATTEPRHPMAHLMPDKAKTNESSIWAAELRAAKKKKGRRIKIITALVFLVVAGVVGPPLGTWLVDAINESGSTKQDEPAATVPPTTAASLATSVAPVAAATTVPGAPTATTAPAGLLGLPGAAEQAVADVNGGAGQPAAPATTVAP